MKNNFTPIPVQFKINEKIKQNNYLVNGNLVNWNGDFSDVYSTISSTKKYKPTHLGEIPNLGKDQALEALDSACNAFDKGKVWPTMKVVDRIKLWKILLKMKKKLL